MNKFETGKTYIVKKDNLYELYFKCTAAQQAVGKRFARFMLVKIDANNIELVNCPIFFSMLNDYYTNIQGKDILIYETDKIEQGGVREVAFSNYENYLWIDSNYVL